MDNQGGSMKKSIVVRAPVLSMSGYGQQSRFALRALRKYESFLDIYVIPIGWGQTGWVHDDTEERNWLDAKIKNTVGFMQNGGKFDYSLQITIPNEWENMATKNIGFTAGIETTKVEPQWIEKANYMDKVIVVSKHSKDVYENATYTGTNKQTGQPMTLKSTTPIDVVNFCIPDFEAVKVDLQLDYDFNYLVVAQNGPRKNVVNTIKWFIEENYDRQVGLVLKVFTKSGSILDREFTEKQIAAILNAPEYKGRECKVYLLHGDMKPEEMLGLYKHPKIKALISITHGEGYGLPMFEAAYSGLPIITTGWSGQCDFLYIPTTKKKGKKNKTVMKAGFAEVEYDIAPIPAEAAWEGVVGKDSSWCYPRQGSYKMNLRRMLKNYDKSLKRAEELQKWVKENFKPEDQYEKFVKAMEIDLVQPEDVDYVWVSDFFADQLTGGAEMSLQALMNKSPEGEHVRINSDRLTEDMVEHYKNCKWVIGNIANLKSDIRDLIVSKGIDYTFVEFDYKFCEYRNPLLYETLEEEKCEYSSTELGQAMVDFVNASRQTFFMSQRQKDIYIENLKGLKEDKLCVLSSVFDDSFFAKIEELRQSQNGAERDKWIVLGSRSWVKGSTQSEEYCKENNMDYEIVTGLGHDELLDKMSTAKGICFKPSGLDTCPRFVIEAKLLGCELELNENVQHLEEDWFKSEDVDKTIAYLKQRPTEFWSRVSA